MEPSTKVYRADEVAITLGGDLLRGFADGEFVTIKEDSPRVVKVVGTDGEVAVSKHFDRSGSMMLTLLQTSDSNDYLQSLMDANEQGPGMPGIRPLYVRDLNGRALHEASHAWVEEAPEVKYDRTATARAWKIGFGKLRNQVRGSTSIG